MTARYAIYYAPKPSDPLMELAANWLGRDAFTGATLTRMTISTLADLDLDALTSSPRHYGFHATLKAPFELSPDHDEAGLIARLHDFCAVYSPFIGEIAPMSLSSFVAFRQTNSAYEMRDLHEACVHGFEMFRAPLSEGDIARRRRAGLTAIQDARLLKFGYPYIFDEFRFHMTLTGSVVDEVLRTRIISALEVYFDRFCGPHLFWGLSLFKQENRMSDFRIIQQSAFLGDHPPKAP